MKFLKDDKRGQNRLEKLLSQLALVPHVSVGILQDGPVTKRFSMLDLATVHEFGSKDGRIPQRSFIRATCDKKQKEYLGLMAKLQNQYLERKLTLKQALAKLGSVVEKDIVTTIVRGIEPSLKPATIKRKKSSKPLIDTGRLKGAITHEVRGAS